ncbi:E3 ubiquitin-protein ligase siah2-like [Diorhabda sublineata]|uniref:E3 ubiquitin-protein ligase siah2-like n=1 Tax=Diorhabda sublineata TaxID=1163346 RepID=UPI0024E14592|nr:E3 ubiquitin-protein ligase siah2-like [Diorhabda sublineata]
MSVPSPEDIMKCPICLETMQPPIIQCKVGHSMCKSCITGCRISNCPTCRSQLTETRNYQLEQLIEGLQKVLKLQCVYYYKGCKYDLTQQDKQTHEMECKYRKFHCEGNKFANLNCDWKGEFAGIYKHFKDSHPNNTRMEYKTDATMKISLNRDFKDVQIISFFNGQQYFYYKHQIDVTKQKAYWHFQLIGLKSQAENYYYEFEIHNNSLRKFKVTEFCTSDTTDINTTFAQEKCVAVSFTGIKNYLNEFGELHFKFRIMANKKTRH